MLGFNGYISDIPDINHQNFAQLLEQVSKDHADKDAILYRYGKQYEKKIYISTGYKFIITDPQNYSKIKDYVNPGFRFKLGFKIFFKGPICGGINH